MMRDIDPAQLRLSEMLADWHNWSRHTAARSGLPGRAAGFGQSRSNSQFDWESGIESELVDKRIMEGFDAAIERIRQRNLHTQPLLFTALQFEAKNLAVGYRVWTSPRLPKGEELAILIMEARNTLLRELARDGVICG
jgi:hypothetical protein